MPRKVRREDEWSDDEIVLAIASCPRQSQSYSPRHRNVIELADLLGRSRGAVSHRFANISHLIFGEGHGEPHVSQRTRDLFDEYRGRDTELQRKAAEIRDRLMRRDPTPRAEVEVSKDRAKQLTLEVFEAASKLPEGSVQTYEREGSWHLGVILNLSRAISVDRALISQYLVSLAGLLGKGSVRSYGFDLAVEGKWETISIQFLSREAPRLHPSELDPESRFRLAVRLWEMDTPSGWRVTEWPATLPEGVDRAAEAKRVGDYFHIDASALCDSCLLMLKDLVDRWTEAKPGAE